MGRLADWNNGTVKFLAFFPVVAIITNLSTRILLHKSNKKNQDGQIN